MHVIFILKWHNWVKTFGSSAVFTNWPTQYLTSKDVTKSTHCSRVVLENLLVSQLAKRIPAFCAKRRFITALARDCHFSLSWATSIQSTLAHSVYVRFIRKLSLFVRFCSNSFYDPIFYFYTFVSLVCFVCHPFSSFILPAFKTIQEIVFKLKKWKFYLTF